jgi:anti-sigma factor ChrR (cupin superfamily)
MEADEMLLCLPPRAGFAMNPHPEFTELQSFAERRLPPAAMLRLDRHLAGCESCRNRLAGLKTGSSTAALRQIVAAGAHLPYEQLQSYVDNKLAAPQQAAVTAHTALCPMCRRELNDLQRHAEALRQPLAAAAPKREGLGRLWQWLPAAAAAGFVAAVALTVVLRRDEVSAPESGAHTAAQGAATPASELRHDVLDQLAPVSPTAAAAWRARDFPRLVDALRPLADQRNPAALSALASLYAQGLGVPKDLRMAEQLWQRAADLGQPGARANAEAVRRMTGTGQ